MFATFCQTNLLTTKISMILRCFGTRLDLPSLALIKSGFFNIEISNELKNFYSAFNCILRGKLESCHYSYNQILGRGFSEPFLSPSITR